MLSQPLCGPLFVFVNQLLDWPQASLGTRIQGQLGWNPHSLPMCPPFAPTCLNPYPTPFSHTCLNLMRIITCGYPCFLHVWSIFPSKISSETRISRPWEHICQCPPTRRRVISFCFHPGVILTVKTGLIWDPRPPNTYALRISFVYYINMSWVRELHLMRVISIHLSVWPFWPFLHTSHHSMRYFPPLFFFF